MPQVQGLLETALYAEDMHRTPDFYGRVVGFARIFTGDRLIAMDVAGRSVLLIFAKGAGNAPNSLPGGSDPTSRRLLANAFCVCHSEEDVEAWREHFIVHQVPIESTVDWPEGAISLYFRDPDQNLDELIPPGFWSIY